MTHSHILTEMQESDALNAKIMRPAYRLLTHTKTAVVVAMVAVAVVAVVAIVPVVVVVFVGVVFVVVFVFLVVIVCVKVRDKAGE